MKTEKDQTESLNEENAKLEQQIKDVKTDVGKKQEQIDVLVDTNEIIFSLNNFEREARVVFQCLQELDVKLFEVDQKLDTLEGLIQSKKSTLTKYRRQGLWSKQLEHFKRESDGLRKKWKDLEKQ